MTASQLITLLRIFGGSFNGKKHRDSDKEDAGFWLKRGYIEDSTDDGALYVTGKGHDFVKQILKGGPK